MSMCSVTSQELIKADLLKAELENLMIDFYSNCGAKMDKE